MSVSGHHYGDGLPTDSRYSWARLMISSVIGIICGVSHWAAVALMPAIQDDFALTRAQASEPYIAIMGGFLLGSPLLGRWTDRIGIAKVLMLSALTISLGYLGGSMASSWPLFLASQVVVGIGSSVSFAPLTADLTHWFVRRRGLAISISTGIASLSGLFWSTVTADALALGTWRQVHVYVAIGVLAVIPLSLLLLRRVPESVLTAADIASTRRIAQTAMSPAAIKWMLLVAGIGCCIAMATPQVHIVALCTDLGYSLTQGNNVLITMALAGLVSRLVVGLTIDRVGPLVILLICSALQMSALLAYIQADALPSLQLVSVLFGLAQGGILPAYPLIIRQFLPARLAGTAIGLVSIGTLLGMAVGSWMSGLIFDHTGSYGLALLNGFFWNALNFLIIFSLYWRLPPAITVEPRPHEAS